ncbi:MAG: class I tRNA ligase family protein, partial [Nitrososphaerota archaeon]|nr:class I tRNA ligase family protein [Nitrososphaerota archaeon]
MGVDLAEPVVEAVRRGEVRIHPERWLLTFFRWMEEIQDWCISRQIWWGHRVPLDGETDVLDTWFSSALWPMATLGWPRKTKDFQTFYPTALNP